MSASIRQIALHAWCLGFACITFDRFLNVEVGTGLTSVTLKISFLLFLVAFLLTCGSMVGENGIRAAFSRYFGIFRARPWIFTLPLLLYSTAIASFAPLPTKAFLYSGWLGFDLVAIVATGLILFGNDPEASGRSTVVWFRYLAASVLVLGTVVHIDYFAHFLGYKSGLIGYNQGNNSWYINSRPHAFSYEPSYLALYFACAIPYLVFDSQISKRPALPRFLAIAAFVVAMNVMLFTFARSVIIFLFLLLTFLLFYLYRAGKLPRVGLGKLGLSVAVALGIMIALTPRQQLRAVYEIMVYRAFTGFDASLSTRFDSYPTTWEIVRDTKMRGIGAGSSYYYWYYNLDGKSESPPIEQASPDQPGETGRQKIQSLWLEVLAENGLLGFLAYLGFALTFIAAAYRAMRVSRSGIAYIAFASVTTFFLFMAHWLPNVSRSDVWVWFTIWGASLVNLPTSRPAALDRS